MQKIKAICEHCQTGYWLSEDAVGRACRCKKCNKQFRVSVFARTVDRVEHIDTTADPGELPNPANDAATRSFRKFRLGRFEVADRLGAGACATVYRAIDLVLQREVALKIPLQKLESESDKSRFLREPKAAAQLRHPNIVPVYDAGLIDDQYFIASALIDGSSLRQHLQTRTYSFRQTSRLVQLLAEALAYAHSKGIIHRDIKPANIMVDRDQQPMVADFGLARILESSDQMTFDGQVMGTPAYMSPEQATGDHKVIGPQSDQYSLGVVLYEMLCGQRPFEGPPALVISRIINEEFAGPASINKKVPVNLGTICRKATARDPSQRYADCSQMAEDLRRWSEDRPILARKTSTIEKLARLIRRNPVPSWSLIAAFVLMVLSTALGITFAVSSNSAAKRDRQATLRIKTAQAKLQNALSLAQKNESSAKQAENEARDSADRASRAEQAARSALDEQIRLGKSLSTAEGRIEQNEQTIQNNSSELFEQNQMLRRNMSESLFQEGMRLTRKDNLVGGLLRLIGSYRQLPKDQHAFRSAIRMNISAFHPLAPRIRTTMFDYQSEATETDSRFLGCSGVGLSFYVSVVKHTGDGQAGGWFVHVVDETGIKNFRCHIPRDPLWTGDFEMIPLRARDAALIWTSDAIFVVDFANRSISNIGRSLIAETLKNRPFLARNLFLLANETRLAVYGSGCLRVLNLETDTPARDEIALQSTAGHLVSSTRDNVAFVAYSKEIKTVNLLSGRTSRRSFEMNGDTEGLLYNEKKKRLAAWAESNVRIWNDPIRQVSSFDLHHPAKVIESEFSQNGNFLVTVARDNLIRVWDIKKRTAVFEQTVPDLVVDRDARRVSFLRFNNTSGEAFCDVYFGDQENVNDDAMPPSITCVTPFARHDIVIGKRTYEGFQDFSSQAFGIELIENPDPGPVWVKYAGSPQQTLVHLEPDDDHQRRVTLRNTNCIPNTIQLLDEGRAFISLWNNGGDLDIVFGKLSREDDKLRFNRKVSSSPVSENAVNDLPYDVSVDGEHFWLKGKVGDQTTMQIFNALCQKVGDFETGNKVIDYSDGVCVTWNPGVGIEFRRIENNTVNGSVLLVPGCRKPPELVKSSDNRLGIFTDERGFSTIVDIGRFERISHLDGVEQDLKYAVASPDGKLLGAIHDNRYQIWDLVTGCMIGPSLEPPKFVAEQDTISRMLGQLSEYMEQIGGTLDTNLVENELGYKTSIDGTVEPDQPSFTRLLVTQ